MPYSPKRGMYIDDDDDDDVFCAVANTFRIQRKVTHIL
jgi:hypothetical protein